MSFVFTAFASETGTVQQTASSTFRFLTSTPLNSNPSGPGSLFAVYSGVYPDVSATSTSVGPTGTYNFPIYFIVTANYAACSSDNLTYFECDMEQVVGGLDGDYWLLLQSPLNSFDVDWYQLTRSGSVWTYTSSLYFYGNLDTYNTRFTGLSFTTSTSTGSTTLSVDVGYFIDLSEVDTTNPKFNPSLVDFSLALVPGTDISSRGESILPLTQGFSTTTVTWLDVADGTYDLSVKFWSQSATFNSANHPFDRAYIYGRIVIVSGAIVSIELDEFYDGTQPIYSEIQYLPCSFTLIHNCVSNIFKYLFIPSPLRIEQSLTSLSNTDYPFVAGMYQAYVDTQSFLSASGTYSTSSLSLTMENPATGQDLHLFALSDMTYLMGSAKPIFRGLAQSALVLGFLWMVVNSIRKVLIVRSENYKFN